MIYVNTIPTWNIYKGFCFITQITQNDEYYDCHNYSVVTNGTMNLVAIIFLLIKLTRYMECQKMSYVKLYKIL